MRYPSFPNVAKRIRERLVTLGWVNQATGEPDIAGFIRAYHYDARSFYPWTNLEKGRTPAGANLARLCKDLQVTPGWLLMGEGKPSRPRRPVTISGGAGAAQPHPEIDDNPGIGRNLFISSTLHPVAYQTHPIGRRRFVANPLHGLALAA